jgi:hypothetical protein
MAWSQGTTARCQKRQKRPSRGFAAAEPSSWGSACKGKAPRMSIHLLSCLREPGQCAKRICRALMQFESIARCINPAWFRLHWIEQNAFFWTSINWQERQRTGKQKPPGLLLFFHLLPGNNIFSLSALFTFYSENILFCRFPGRAVEQLSFVYFGCSWARWQNLPGPCPLGCSAHCFPCFWPPEGRQQSLPECPHQCSVA